MAMMVMENQQSALQMQLIPVPSRPPLPPPPPAPQAYKHHCKVCKKGFMCGRALGGHMRAHGIGDDGLSADDTLDDDSAPHGGGAGESSETGNPSRTTKGMYALRTNPGRLRNCLVCENCGKEFTSWKSLLDHGRCNFDEDDDLDGSLRSSPLNDADDGEEEELALAGGWSKGKRSRRAKVMAVGGGSISKLHLPTPSSEEEDLANCLVMLSSSRAAQPVVVDADQESSASASKDKAERNRLLVPQPISMVAPAAAQMILLGPQVVPLPQHVPTLPRGMFECKACKKVFASHQALGGHRASHKKVKGCFAAKLESNRSETHQQAVSAAAHDNTKAIADVIADTNTDANITSVNANVDGKTTNVGSVEVVMATAVPEMAVMAVDDVAPVPYAVSPFKKKGKVHECSVCHRVFTSGQALGGHKRCHWLTSSAKSDPAGAVAKLQPVAPDHVMADLCHQLTLGSPMFGTTDQRMLDLNVPTNPSADQVVVTRQAAELNDSPLCLNAPASVYMQSWTGHNNASHVNKTPTSSGNDAAVGGGAATEDEADSTSAKRAKISDLKDMNVAGEPLPWLQVGIGFSSSESKEEFSRVSQEAPEKFHRRGHIN